MKKFILSIAILSFVLITSTVNAQGLGIGIKGGLNFANQSLKSIPDLDPSSRTGFHGGAYVVLAFSEKWGIQPELLFSSQGSELPNSTSKFNYMSIPVLIRWKPISLISIEGGPQFSTLLDGELELDGEDFEDEIKNSDFGLALGATAHLPFGLNGGIRYVWGFTNVADFSDDREVKNTVFQIYVGWTLLGAN